MVTTICVGDQELTVAVVVPNFTEPPEAPKFRPAITVFTPGCPAVGPMDPISGDAAKLSPEEKQRILGGEAAMWSEHVGPETIDSRIWPRTAAVAERLWSPESVRDVSSMYRRLNQISWRLDSLGLTHNTDYIPMLQRIANSEDVRPLRALADVVEPVKDYQREEFAKTPPTSFTPLNRLIDAARPESETARIFSNLVDEFVSGGCKDAAKSSEIRSRLTAWRDVYPRDRKSVV